MKFDQHSSSFLTKNNKACLTDVHCIFKKDFIIAVLSIFHKPKNRFIISEQFSIK